MIDVMHFSKSIVRIQSGARLKAHSSSLYLCKRDIVKEESRMLVVGRLCQPIRFRALLLLEKTTDTTGWTR